MAGFTLRPGGWARPFARVFAQGDEIDGRYRVLRSVAVGGMGRIYQAKDVTEGRLVAVKVLSLPTEDRVMTERFEREARILESLSSRHVVRSFGRGTTAEGQHFLVLEWLEGQDLEHRLKKGPPLDLETTYAVGRGALSGLAAIHASGVVHRDVKPGNIFLTEEGEPPASVKLLDFGVSKTLEDEVIGQSPVALTVAGMVLGTPFYMAPEQAQGKERIDHRADLFSLASVLYECVTGQRAFDGSSAMALLVRIASESPRSVRELDPSLPAPLDAFFVKALARAPEARFQSAAEMESALEALGAQPVEFLPSFGDTASVEVTERMPEGDLPFALAASAPEGHAPLPTLRTSLAPDGAPGEQRWVTMLLADLSQVGAQRRLAWAVFQRAVQARGGEAHPLRGGLAIGLFGGAEGSGDEPKRALEAALALFGLDLSSVRETDVSLQSLRAALSTGVIERQQSGSHITGEALDDAAELLSFAEPGELIADPETLEASKLQVATRARARNAFVITGRARPGGPEAARRSLLFVGRERELEVLTRAFERGQRERRTQVALVSGAPGQGKSRLREELRRRLVHVAPGSALIFGQAGPSGRTNPLSIFADAMRRRGSILGNEAASTLVAKLGRLIPKEVGPSARDQALSGLARLVGAHLPDLYATTAPSDAVPAPAEDRQGGRRARLALQEVLTAYAANAPTVLLLEDAQWADDMSLELIRDLAMAEPPVPLYIVLFGRPELLENSSSLLAALPAERLTRVELPPLDAEAVARVAAGWLGEGIDPRFNSLLFERTGGNPYFLEEVLHAVDDRRAPDARSWSALKARLETVPRGVRAMAQARLDALAPELREVLKRASVFGPSFWGEGLCALGVDRWSEGVAALADLGLVEPRSSSRYLVAREYAFRSSLLRDVAYAMLLEREKPLLHGHAADWLMEAGESDPIILAHHRVAAQESERASLALLEAAERTLSLGDLEAAESLAERGLSITQAHEPLVRLHKVLVEAALEQGDFERGLVTLERMQSLPRAEAHAAWMELRRGSLTLHRGNAHRALQCFQKAEQLALDAGQWRSAASARLGRGDAHRDRGDVMLAFEAYQQTYGDGRREGDLRLVADALLRLGKVAYATSDLGQALRLFQESESTLFGFLDEDDTKGQVKLALGATCLQVGDHPRAEETLRAASELLAGRMNGLGARLASIHSAMSELERGLPEADARLAALHRDALSSESKHDLFLAGLYRVRALLESGRSEEARDLVEPLRDQAVRSVSRFVVPLESALGLARARTGAAADGVRYTVAAVHRLQSKKGCEDEDPPRIYAQHAEALERAGEAELAREFWGRAKSTAEEIASRLPTSVRPLYLARPAIGRILGRG